MTTLPACYRCRSQPCECKDGVSLYLGDCRDVVPLLGCQVASIVTDPPYAIPTLVAQGRTVTRNVGDLSIVEAGLGLMFGLCEQQLKAGGRWLIFCDGNSYPVLYRVFYGRFKTALLVWDKGRIGMGREFRKQHELVLHAWEDTTPVVGSDGRGVADVLQVPPVGGDRMHDAQKPVALLEQLLRVCEVPILDPFAGSGTTGVAAKRLGRRCILIEIEEKYCEVIKNRLANEPIPLFTDEPEEPRDTQRELEAVL